MRDLDSVMAELKSKGAEKNRITYARHGVPMERTFGVSNADLKIIAKTIKGQQALALELYTTGIMDAMYLAGIIADGKKMSARELQAWADGAAEIAMIAEHTVPWVTVESSHGHELALKWIKSKKEHLAATGWRSYAGIVTTTADEVLDLEEIEGLLKKVVAEVHGAPNRVKSTMNGFVMSVGIYVKPLSKQAKDAAAKIGVVSVDVGDTDCKVSVASEYIANAEAKGRAGVKKKTVRC